MLSDVGALVLALAAARLARRPPSRQMTFGLARAEVLGAFLNGLALFIACAAILWEAGSRVQHGPPHVEGLPVFVVGLLGLAINLGSLFHLLQSDRTNLNIRGAIVHMAADALGSLGAVGAALLLMAGFPAADAGVAVLVALLVAWSALALVRDAGRVLLELPPKGMSVAAVCDTLRTIDGVVDVHDVHAWSLDGQRPMISAHLVIDDDHSLDGMGKQARRAVSDAHHVAHATFQLERRDERCPASCDVDVP